MGKVLLTALCLIALTMATARAGDLSGRWNVRMPINAGYEGVVLIDGKQRATWDAPQDNGRPAKFLGYVQFNDGSRIELVLTNRTAVAHINCLVAAPDLLHCQTIRGDKSTSSLYSLVRVGPAPENLTAPR